MSLKTIRLYGHLGERFGRVFRLDVQSPAEAVHALSIQLKGFREALVGSPSTPCRYRVSAGKRTLSAPTLRDPCGEIESIRIVPVLCGAGENGWGQTILGLVMVVASISYPVLAAPGWAMMIGGVVQMITAPDTGEVVPPEEAGNQPSYVFDGAVNTAAQGNPVPLCYGRMTVGSQVISAGLSVEQV